MIVLGLTGSIGMGKSTAATMLRRMGLPLHDADAAVHRLMAAGGAAVAEIGAAFPGTVVAGQVDRGRLGARVFEDGAALKRLEAILHPKVRAATTAFLKMQARRQRDIAVLDIPLLFETGGERLCDAVVVVTAPPFVQAARVLPRPGMTPERLAAIRARQMSEAEKCRRADFVIHTGRNKGDTLRSLAHIVRLLRRPGAVAALGPRRTPGAHPRPGRLLHA